MKRLKLLPKVASLCFLVLIVARCQQEEIVEKVILKIDGGPSIEMSNVRCSFNEGLGGLYISGTKSATTVSASLYDYSMGETGVFNGADYHTTTNCASLFYSGESYTSGEYTGDNPASYAQVVINESGEVMKGSFAGLLEDLDDPNQTVQIEVEYLVKCDD